MDTHNINISLMEGIYRVTYVMQFENRIGSEQHATFIKNDNSVFNLITAHAPISAQSSNLVVFRLHPVYFYLLLHKKML